LALAKHSIPNCKPVISTIGIDCHLGSLAAMTERCIESLCWKDKIGTYPARDRLAIISRYRRMKFQPICDVKLPAYPDQSETIPHEKAIAEFILTAAMVIEANHAAPPAI